MLYSYTHMATVGVKGLSFYTGCRRDVWSLPKLLQGSWIR